MPTITWLRKRGVKARYLENTKSDKAKDKDKAIERWTKEGRLPPASYPVGPRAPMWAQELLDHWDFLDENERQIVLDTWPDWRGALVAIAERSKATEEATEPVEPALERKRKRKATAHQEITV